MTIDPTRPRPAGEDRAGSALGRALGRLRRVGTAERMRILTIGGRAIRVAVREGTPGRREKTKTARDPAWAGSWVGYGGPDRPSRPSG